MLPRLCFHKHARQFYVRIQGRTIYLGTDERTAEAERLRLLAHGQRTEMITVQTLLALYLEHAHAHYVHADGTPTSEVASIKDAMKPIQAMYGHTRAEAFGPLAFERVVLAMADGSWNGSKGWCRKYANRQASRVKRIFRWAVTRELIPPAVYQALAAVPGLRAGRARETADVTPAPEAAVEHVRKRVCPMLRDMIDLQLLTGMRPGELRAMTPGAIDQAGPVWTYRPGQHKTAHHGHQRIIPIGPKAQQILAPYLLDRLPGTPLFSPAEARLARYAALRAARRSPVPPSQQARKKPNPKRRPGDSWTASAYAYAIQKACAGAERWHPHQLRHNAATRLQREFGWEVARVVCGHHSLHATRIYVAEDLQRAFEAVAQVG